MNGARIGAFVRSLLLLTLTLSAGRAASAQAAPEPVRYIPGEILVGFAKYPNGPSIAPAQALQGVGQVLRHNPVLGVARVRINSGLTIGQAIAIMRSRPGVRYAEPNYICHTTAVPNDPSYSSQYGPQIVHMEQAWGIWQPQAVKALAIVDTGVDTNHPDLTDVIYRDGSGNVIGTNIINPSATPDDDGGHGTHCAGIAAAHINNGIGIAGVAGWNPNVLSSDTFVKIMPVKVLDSTGSGTDADVATGIQWATDHGAAVISMSLGEASNSTTLSDAVAYAINHDVVVCAAAGNNGSSNFFYPAAYANVISVAATNNTDTLASFSNYGSWVKVAAPGVNIYSTLPTTPGGENFGTNYGTLSGTSMACPHVAGEAALLRSAFPSLTNSQVSGYITGNVDPYNPYNSRTIAPGAGRINVYNALVSANSGTNGIISVSLSPNPLTGGISATGTVTLGSAAPTGGTVIAVSSDNGNVGVPASVTVSAGNTQATFTATTQPVASTVTATITATGPDNVKTGSLMVTPPFVAGVSMNPASVTGGSASTGTVTLSGVAAAGGRVVNLASNKASATVGSSVTVPAGSSSATFTVSTTPVTSNTTATITAKTDTTSKSASLGIKAAAPASVAFSPSSVVGGDGSTGTVTLTGPAAGGGLTVSLNSSKTEATVPASVFIAAGASSATFNVTTSNVTTNTTASISATANGVTRSGALTILPMLKSVGVSPSSVVGGKTAKGTITLNGAAPAGGVSVSLSTTNTAVSVPPSVTVAAGATTATFTVSTSPVSSNTSGTVSGTGLGVTKTSATFTVKPPALSSVKFSPGTIVQGTTSTCTLTLTGKAPAGFTVTLTSANPSVVPVPASVTFTAGSTTATFTVTGGAVSAQTSVQVTGKDPANVTKTGTLTVKVS